MKDVILYRNDECVCVNVLKINLNILLILYFFHIF